MVGFKVESIESECGSKDRARLFPRTKVSPVVAVAVLCGGE